MGCLKCNNTNSHKHSIQSLHNLLLQVHSTFLICSSVYFLQKTSSSNTCIVRTACPGTRTHGQQAFCCVRPVVLNNLWHMLCQSDSHTSCVLYWYECFFVVLLPCESTCMHCVHLALWTQVFVWVFMCHICIFIHSFHRLPWSCDLGFVLQAKMHCLYY